MRFIVKFTDNEEHADKRQKFMTDHLAFLAKNSDAVLAAGPLVETETGAGAGGLWVVDADDAAAVQALVEADPFFPTGLRKDIKIQTWKIVFEHGEAKI